MTISPQRANSDPGKNKLPNHFSIVHEHRRISSYFVHSCCAYVCDGYLLVLRAKHGHLSDHRLALDLPSTAYGGVLHDQNVPTLPATLRPDPAFFLYLQGPEKGVGNVPGNLSVSRDWIASLKGVPADVVAETTTANARRLFPRAFDR